MATTSPDNIWTPDSGDDYALTVDLAATADTVQDALTALRAEMNAQPFVQRGATTISGDGSVYTTVSVTFPTPFASPPTVLTGSEMAGSTSSSHVMVSKANGVTATGFMLALKATTSFSSTYGIPWIAVGARP